jgi:hypothetical protein
MSDIIEVIKDVTTVTIASDGPQGPTGPTGATGAAGATGATGSSGVISVVAPITNTGTSTSAVIGINSGVANGVATLDSNGKVPQSQIPAVAITNTFVVASQAAMLALTAEEGDVAVRTDQNKTYILTATPASTLANWQELLTPTDSVTSVDGLIGTVTLTDKYAQLATANTFTGGVQQITTASAATKGLIVKATASQSANLQEWQNSSGGLLLSVDSTGNVVAPSASGTAARFRYFDGTGAVGTYIDTANVSGALSMVARSTTVVTVIVKGVASQTGDLQQWQNSAGTVLASITSAGTANVANLVATESANSTVGWSSSNFQRNSSTGLIQLILQNFSGASFRITNGNAAANPLIVRGAASQTANLQEWQNSGATTLTAVNAAGTINFASGNTSATANTGAVALPALAVGFITMQVAGTTVKVPYYAN